jgi:hypothetical protein
VPRPATLTRSLVPPKVVYCIVILCGECAGRVDKDNTLHQPPRLAQILR